MESNRNGIKGNKKLQWILLSFGLKVTFQLQQSILWFLFILLFWSISLLIESSWLCVAFNNLAVSWTWLDTFSMSSWEAFTSASARSTLSLFSSTFFSKSDTLFTASLKFALALRVWEVSLFEASSKEPLA